MQIGLHHGTGFIARAIQWQTRSRWNHASLWLGDWCYEAREFAGVIVSRRSLREYEARLRGEEIQFFELREPLSEEVVSQRLRPFLEAHAGKAYDYLSVLRFISRRKAPANDRWFCSEFVFAALEASGVRLLERLDAANVSPAHLALSPCLVPAGAGTMSSSMTA